MTPYPGPLQVSARISAASGSERVSIKRPLDRNPLAVLIRHRAGERKVYNNDTMKSWNRSNWAGLAPNGVGQVKPNHYLEMAKVVWRNRDQLPFAWRILTRGVCDGCALGTAGVRDFTMDGVHLCMVRLELMRLNTGPAL